MRVDGRCTTSERVFCLWFSIAAPLTLSFVFLHFASIRLMLLRRRSVGEAKRGDSCFANSLVECTWLIRTFGSRLREYRAGLRPSFLSPVQPSSTPCQVRFESLPLPYGGNAFQLTGPSSSSSATGTFTRTTHLQLKCIGAHDSACLTRLQ
ncbi:hypothetical protein BJ546DRAFT_293039 [Cryomyces antarcticus]